MTTKGNLLVGPLQGRCGGGLAIPSILGSRESVLGNTGWWSTNLKPDQAGASSRPVCQGEKGGHTGPGALASP